MDWKIFAVAAVVIASGCTALSGAQEDKTDTRTPNTEPSELEENTTTIYFTGSGFQPGSITVGTGTTVTWINNASSSMWVASDRHPNHREYSGTSRTEHCQSGDQSTAAFDQCSTGDRFSFTFEKTGEWRYHNHEPYVRGGSVTVVER